MPALPSIKTLRDPEFGLVMARGRIGGGGAAFNFGEMTVTRAAVQLSTGETGYGYVLGRRRRQAYLVACFDALWQTETHRQRVEHDILAPTRTRLAAEEADSAAKTAATRVNFFTMVRGEDS